MTLGECFKIVSLSLCQRKKGKKGREEEREGGASEKGREEGQKEGRKKETESQTGNS